MPALEGAREKPNNVDSARQTTGVKLLKFSLYYGVFQIAIDWIGYYVFSSSLEISRTVHSFFAGVDNFTPVLQRLKVGYQVPIKGWEFPQVFSVYLFLFAFLCIYFVVFFGILFKLIFPNLQWQKIVARDYAVLLLCLALSFGEIYFFFVGPSTSLRNYRGIFGADFIGSVCLLLPLAQSLILSILAFYYAVGGNSRQKN